MIPYGHQWIDDDDVDAVVEVLRGDWLTQGPSVPAFENAVAEYCGAKHAVAVSSGTAALHLACLAMDLGEDDLLWTSPNSFAASANCARYCGADVDFVDIDPVDYNMSVAMLEAKLERAQADGRSPRVLIPVHHSGRSCDMRAIAALARRHGIAVIEDACHALGGTYEDQPVGSCAWSDMAVLSFHPVKSITTGEGGMVLTNDDHLAGRLRLLRSHGITRDPSLMENEGTSAHYYEQIELGYNYRLTDIQAALGISQMRRLDMFVEKRRGLARRYGERLTDLPLRMPLADPDDRSSWHLYSVRLGAEAPITRDEAVRRLTAAGIGTSLHYVPIHLHPYYRRLGFKPGDFPEAERYAREALTLPLFPTLSHDEQDQVISALSDVLGG